MTVFVQIKEVKKCTECPNIYVRCFSSYLGGSLGGPSEIPDWCPLLKEHEELREKIAKFLYLEDLRPLYTHWNDLPKVNQDEHRQQADRFIELLKEE